MIQFKSNAPLCYCVVEGGTVHANGRLHIVGNTVTVQVLDATEQTLDFLFRGMLNVCASMQNYTVFADLDSAYLTPFGFRPSQGSMYAVAAQSIVFPCRCCNEQRGERDST